MSLFDRRGILGYLLKEAHAHDTDASQCSIDDAEEHYIQDDLH